MQDKCFSQAECRYMKIHDYDSAIRYLYALELFGIKLGLQNIRLLLKKLGDPHLSLKYVHVGGTNGKGSVCAMLSSILSSAGYRVGLYTSPHLSSFSERIQINGEYVPKEVVVDLTKELQKLALEVEAELEVHPTYFEVTTAMALKHFADEKVDLAVMEVGMGGRFDATNVISPLVSVINDISFDHMEYLGDTLEAIASEKAGIIKPGVPVISSDQVTEAMDVIKKAGDEKHSPLYVLGTDFNCDVVSSDRTGVRLDVEIVNPELRIKPDLQIFHELLVPLIGQFQAKNAVMTIAVLGVLSKNGFDIDPVAITDGLSKVTWPARIQVMQGSPTVILDSSHNPVSIRNLVSAVEEYFEYDKIILVIGLLKEKERDKIVAELARLKPTVIAVKPDSPRALEPEILLDEFRSAGSDGIVKKDILDGINYAIATARPGDLVVITGSFYTAGTAIKYWEKKYESLWGEVDDKKIE